MTPEVREKILIELVVLLLAKGGRGSLPTDPSEVKRSMGNAVKSIQIGLMADQMKATDIEIEGVIMEMLSIVMKRAYPQVFKNTSPRVGAAIHE